MSPSASWAWLEMPTVPTSPSTRIHSCSPVKCRLIVLSSLSAVVAVGDEGHWRHGRLEQLAALLELQFRASRAQSGGHIAHGDGPLQRRREGAAGDAADFIAFDVEDQ